MGKHSKFPEKRQVRYHETKFNPQTHKTSCEPCMEPHTYSVHSQGQVLRPWASRAAVSRVSHASLASESYQPATPQLPLYLQKPHRKPPVSGGLGIVQQEAGSFLGVGGQPELHNKILSQNKQLHVKIVLKNCHNSTYFLQCNFRKRLSEFVIQRQLYPGAVTILIKK